MSDDSRSVGLPPLGRPEGNWRWRYTEDALSEPIVDWLRDLTEIANRRGALGRRQEDRLMEVHQPLA